MPTSCNIAVILAAGSGSRAGNSSTPKQLWKLGGIPVWRHSWQLFSSHPQIDHVCLVCPREYVRELRQCLPEEPAYSVIAGGAMRSDSTAQALKFCRQNICPQTTECKILIHDAARPLLSRRMIDESLEALKKYAAVVCALPSKDSLFQQDQQKVSKIIERSNVMSAQTPQSFDFTLLQQAFAKHHTLREIHATDDISVVKHYLPKTEIAVIPGEIRNIKLTDAADFLILESYVKSKELSEEFVNENPNRHSI